MVDLGYISDPESLDSDEELQQAFSEGKLKSGLYAEAPAPKQFINNVNGLKQKLEEFKQNLDWVERLDLTSDPAPAPKGTEITEQSTSTDPIHDDFKRELRFYRQAQASVLEGIPRLHKLGVKTKRPEDYFAEMAKSDDHMKRVREKLLEKQTIMERREKIRKLRDLRKYGKKVQHQVLEKRQKEKRELLDAVKKFRKGQKEKLDYLDFDTDEGTATGDKKKKKGTQSKDKSHIPGKKRQYKNLKFGHGGQKKRSKMNTAESAADMTGFRKDVHQSRPGFDKKKGKDKSKKPGPNKRPGKARRMKNKNKNRRR